MECPDIRCYACGGRGHTANYCDVNRPHRGSEGHNRHHSPGHHSLGRGSSQCIDDRNSNHHENRSSYSSSDKGNSLYNKEKSSALRFNNSS